MENQENRFKEAIDTLKKAGKNTYTYTCENGKQCVLSEPSIRDSIKLLPYIYAMMSPKKNNDEKFDVSDGAIMIVDLCWVAGDDEIRTNEDLKIEVGMSALNTAQIKTADVKKN